jgi:hypothetical protein
VLCWVGPGTVRADYNCLNNILSSTVKGNASRKKKDAGKSLYRLESEEREV